MALLIRLARPVVALTLAAACLATPAAAQESTENDVKAAFLYNFTKFIEWPSLPPGFEPFRVCVVGDAAFARAVDRILEGESIQGHRLVRAEPETPQDARTCAILYVGTADRERGLRMAAALRHTPVLVVGDGPRFVTEGGAIAFVLDKNRVRFDINTSATERAGLKVSSKLLRVARNVKEGGTLR